LPRTRRCQRRHAPGRQRRGNIRSRLLKSSPSPGAPSAPAPSPWFALASRATGTPRSAPSPGAPSRRSRRTAAA
jgi:hypothetical protein